MSKKRDIEIPISNVLKGSSKKRIGHDLLSSWLHTFVRNGVQKLEDQLSLDFVKFVVLIHYKLFDIFGYLQIEFDVFDVIIIILTIFRLFLNRFDIVHYLLAINTFEELDQLWSEYHDIHNMLVYKFRLQF